MSGLANAFDTTAEPGAGAGIGQSDFGYEDDLGGPPPAGGGGERPPRQPVAEPRASGVTAPAPARAGTPAGQPGAQPDGGPPQSSFTDDHYRIAGQFGLSRDEVDRFGDVDTLDRVLGRMYSAAQRSFAAQAGGQAQNPGNPGQQVPEQGGRQPAPSQPPAGASQFSPFDRKLLENLDPEDRGLFEKVIDHYEGPLKQVLSRLEEYEQQFERMQFAQEVEAFDRQIAGLSDAWEDVFGKGSTYDLDPGGAEARNRNRVFEEMDILRDVYSTTGRPVPPLAKLFDNAVRSLFGDRFRQQARHEIKGRLRDHQGRFTGTPTHREGRPLSAEEAAVRFAEQKSREIGLTGSDDGEL